MSLINQVPKNSVLSEVDKKTALTTMVIGGATILVELNQDTLYPYPVTNAGVEECNSVVAYNSDPANNLLIDFLTPNGILTITVKPNLGWYDNIDRYTSIDINSGSTSTDFLLHLKERTS